MEPTALHYARVNGLPKDSEESGHCLTSVVQHVRARAHQAVVLWHIALRTQLTTNTQSARPRSPRRTLDRIRIDRAGLATQPPFELAAHRHERSRRAHAAGAQSHGDAAQVFQKEQPTY